jgi:hypothetical protein
VCLVTWSTATTVEHEPPASARAIAICRVADWPQSHSPSVTAQPRWRTATIFATITSVIRSPASDSGHSPICGQPLAEDPQVGLADVAQKAEVASSSTRE